MQIVTEQQLSVQRDEIRQLVQEIQRAVVLGKIKFNPELDRRIRAQYEQGSMEQARGIER
jgi:hypothetical protein